MSKFLFGERDPSVEYRDLPGFAGYCVGNDGSIWSSWNGNGRGRGWIIGPKWHKLRPYAAKKTGHMTIRLRSTVGEETAIKVHAAVLTAFVGPRPKGLCACHYPDPNPANNRPENLRWATYQQNTHDAIEQGTHKGKLSEEKVREIRKSLASGEKGSVLALRYGVTSTNISNIKNGRIWSNI